MSPDRSSSSMAAPGARPPTHPRSPSLRIARRRAEEERADTLFVCERRRSSGSKSAIRASAASNQTQRADGCLTRLPGPLANQSESYMLFSTSAYFFSTALRRTFRVGVTSPSSTLNSEGKISNRLMVSQRSRDWLASVT